MVSLICTPTYPITLLDDAMYTDLQAADINAMGALAVDTLLALLGSDLLRAPSELAVFDIATAWLEVLAWGLAGYRYRWLCQMQPGRYTACRSIERCSKARSAVSEQVEELCIWVLGAVNILAPKSGQHIHIPRCVRQHEEDPVNRSLAYSKGYIGCNKDCPEDTGIIAWGLGKTPSLVQCK